MRMDKSTDKLVSHFQGTCESDPEGTKFAAKACYTDYYPGPAGQAYQPPACDKGETLTDAQRQMLAKVYKRAPDYVRARLCRLTQFFVTKSTSGEPWGWGFWEGPDYPPGKGVYIATSDQELTGGESVADAENDIVDQLLETPDHAADSEPGLLRLKAAGPPDPELTVLGKIAHELGHVLLSDTNADGTDARHPRRSLVGPPQSDCFETAFLGSSWDATQFHQHMRRWVAFGEQNGNRQVNPEGAFSLGRLREAVQSGKIDVANDAIGGVLRSGEFVSFAAAVAPEEDFVETYKYKVLADARPKQTVGIELSGRNINMLGLLDAGKLAKKVACLRELGLLSGTP